jgi:nucleoside-diphosphate-sugar epimerase
MSTPHVVVFGATGLVGQAAMAAFAQQGFRVTGVSRRGPDIRLDLTDADTCHEVLSRPRFDDVSHVVFAALYERPELVPGWRDPVQIETNRMLFDNAVAPLVSGAELRHVSLLQGTKAYGAHLGPMRVPGREGDPRPPGPNFYWVQEDRLRELAAGHPWVFSILRPQAVCGHAVGSPMNLVIALGVYAAVQRELGEPLRFPGGPDYVTEVTDADLLGRAIHWAATTPACAGETFNVTNGDVLTWRSTVESLADVFGMRIGEPRTMSLAREMPQHAPVWDRIVAGHGLTAPPMQSLVGASWQFADAAFGYGHVPHHTLVSTVKIRQFGFGECIDSLDMFRSRLRTLQAKKVLPP